MANDMDLHDAAKKGDSDQVIALLNLGVDVNARDKYGTTALHYAVDAGHVETCQILIDRGADINAKVSFVSRGAWTPLHWAAEQDQYDCALLLLNNGAKIDESDETGRTPLLGALDEMVAPNIAELLMRRGANIYAKDKFSSVLERAQRYQAHDIVRLWKELDSLKSK